MRAYMLLLFLTVVATRPPYCEAEDAPIGVFSLYAKEPEPIVRLIRDAYPGIDIIQFPRKRGTKITFICNPELGPQIRQKIVASFGQPAVADWCNESPHEWESEQARKLFEMQLPPKPLRELDETALQELSAEEKANLIKDLIYIIENSWTTQTTHNEMHVHQAIRALGLLRAKAAVGKLAENITYVPIRFPGIEGMPNEFRYPAAVSLAQIGSDTNKAMFDILGANPDKTTRELAAWVILSNAAGDSEAALAIISENVKPKMSASELQHVSDYYQAYSKQWGNTLPSAWK